MGSQRSQTRLSDFLYMESKKGERDRDSLLPFLVPTALPSLNEDAFQGGGGHSEDKPLRSSGGSLHGLAWAPPKASPGISLTCWGRSPERPPCSGLGDRGQGRGPGGRGPGAGPGGEEGRDLTQHALGVPGVLVPGLDPVLHGLGDLVEVHVLHGAVHAAAVVGLSRGGGPHYVSHLGVGVWWSGKPLGQSGAGLRGPGLWAH